MAHAPYLTDADLKLFRARGAGVAHCPLSNFYYANAAFPLRRVADAGVAVGLGTDVGGAPSACMFQSCRDAVVASKALHEGVSPFAPLDAPPPVVNAAITHGRWELVIACHVCVTQRTFDRWRPMCALQWRRSTLQPWVAHKPWASTRL